MSIDAPDAGNYCPDGRSQCERICWCEAREYFLLRKRLSAAFRAWRASILVRELDIPNAGFSYVVIRPWHQRALTSADDEFFAFVNSQSNHRVLVVNGTWQNILPQDLTEDDKAHFDKLELQVHATSALFAKCSYDRRLHMRVAESIGTIPASSQYRVRAISMQSMLVRATASLACLQAQTDLTYF